MKKQFRYPLLVFSILISLLVGVYQNCSGTKVSPLSTASLSQNGMIVESSEFVAAEKVVWGGIRMTGVIAPNKRYQIMRNGTSRLKTENLVNNSGVFSITSTVISNVQPLANSANLYSVVDAVSSASGLVQEGMHPCDAGSVSYFLFNNQITGGKYEYLTMADCGNIMLSSSYTSLNLGSLTQALDLL